MATVQINEASFDEEVLGSPVPVVVDFTAEWCAPCHAIVPFLDAISEEMAGAVKIARLDVDRDPAVSTRYGVRSMPTLIVFKDGEPTAMQVGAAPKARLTEWIRNAI